MTPDQIAATFRTARLTASPISTYPGEQVPETLASAYAIQQLAIEAWPDSVVGWKVAAIQPNWQTRYPDERVAGPVFSKRLAFFSEGAVEFPIIRDGYAAAEAEFALLLGEDFPVDTTFATVDQLLPFVAAVHAAVEMAGSPLPTLSTLGPGAVISDFGIISASSLALNSRDSSVGDWRIGRLKPRLTRRRPSKGAPNASREDRWPRFCSWPTAW